MNYKERKHDLMILYKKETVKETKDEIRDLIKIYDGFKYDKNNE